MTEQPLTSASYEVADAVEANELFQTRGWTDGLPVVPPTEASVRRALEAMRLSPGDVVGTEPVRRRRITAEKVAIAAVMAGCLPGYAPVVVAIVRAMCCDGRSPTSVSRSSSSMAAASSSTTSATDRSDRRRTSVPPTMRRSFVGTTSSSRSVSTSSKRRAT